MTAKDRITNALAVALCCAWLVATFYLGESSPQGSTTFTAAKEQGND